MLLYYVFLLVGQTRLNYTEDSPPIHFVPDLSLTDRDLNFPIQRVEISSQPICDSTTRCVLTSPSSLPHSFSYANGIWTVGNASSTENFHRILRELMITFDTPEQIEPSFIFTISVFDSSDTPVPSCNVNFGDFVVFDSFTLNFIPVNDNSPILDLNGPANPGTNFTTTFIEEMSSVQIVDSQLTLVDADRPSLPQYNYRILITVREYF